MLKGWADGAECCAVAIISSRDQATRHKNSDLEHKPHHTFVPSDEVSQALIDAVQHPLALASFPVRLFSCLSVREAEVRGRISWPRECGTVKSWHGAQMHKQAQ